MNRSWTFGQQLVAGFVLTLIITLAMGAFSAVTLRTVVADKDRLVSEYADAMRAMQRLNTLATEIMAYNRGYYLSGGNSFLVDGQESQAAYATTWAQATARAEAADKPALDAIEGAYRRYIEASDRGVEARRGGAAADTLSRRFDAELAPRARALKEALDGFVDRKAAEMEAAKRASNDAAAQAIWLVGLISVLAIALAAIIAVALTRTLTRQVGSAVQHLQSSSVELQAAANQQATGSGQQATAMSEVSTTMKELLSTSRQIADSAQRVARIADDTADAARSGDQAVHQAEEAVTAIQRQVAQIVAHMLELGKKSQQIGSILEIIKELAEQTNILSINATIEAAGAGEHGKRFAAVAEEIRKLADRVGGSAGEIRTLIEEMRAAANTTVMATEDGSKAVDAGARQFEELAGAFQRIVALVDTTAHAAREIELSTKQQTTAVEQVNVAIFDAAQAAKETEASSRQTLQTSSQLAEVSRDLGRLIQPQAS